MLFLFAACIDVPVLPVDWSAAPPTPGPLHTAELGVQPTCWVESEGDLVAVGLTTGDVQPLAPLPFGTTSWATDGERVLALTDDGVLVAPIDTLLFDAPEIPLGARQLIWTGDGWLIDDWGTYHWASSTDALLAEAWDALPDQDVPGPPWAVQGHAGSLVTVESDTFMATTIDGELLEEVRLGGAFTGHFHAQVAATEDHVITLSRFGDGTLRGAGVYLRQFERRTGRRVTTVEVSKEGTPNLPIMCTGG
jgi:hypothetical protein